MSESFARELEAAARRFGARTALACHDEALTYEALERKAGGFARFLAGRGVKPGDRMALISPNRWQFPVALLGGLKLGATVVPIDPQLKAEERRAILDDLCPALVVEEVPDDEALWPIVGDASAPALILYTSGSTGAPKGAVLSHGALKTAVRSWASAVMALTPEDNVLAVLPLSHSYGLAGALLAPLWSGAQAILLERFSPEDVVETIRTRYITVFPGVATMFRRILDAAAFERAAFAGVRVCVSGAATCPWELAREWREQTGTRILRGYGMTELFRAVSYRAADATEVPDSVGLPLPDVQVLIVDEERKDVAAGTAGELWIRTPAAMDGYFGAPQETQAVLADGWFRTGDLATLTPNGYVCIQGRKRERIVRGGYSIFPQEVEAALAAHPSVLEAAVVGEGDPELGEEVVAFVALREGPAVSKEALVDWCRERLAAWKYPRRIVIVDRLPRASTGKVLKSRLSGRS